MYVKKNTKGVVREKLVCWVDFLSFVFLAGEGIRKRMRKKILGENGTFFFFK